MSHYESKAYVIYACRKTWVCALTKHNEIWNRVKNLIGTSFDVEYLRYSVMPIGSLNQNS